MTFTDKESYFESEASLYRLLKAHDSITPSAFIVKKADNKFRDKTFQRHRLRHQSQGLCCKKLVHLLQTDVFSGSGECIHTSSGAIFMVM